MTSGANTIDFSTVHAVLIDDDSTDLDVLAVMLKQLGASYTTLRASEDAAMRVQGLAQVSVVFLDLEMPDKDGYQVMDEIQVTLGYAVPIVAYTAHATEIVNARRAGFHSFLGKPISNAKFRHNLTRILNDDPVWERVG